MTDEKIVSALVNGAAYPCALGANLGDFLAGLGFGDYPCGGHGKCGKCRVTAVGALSEPSEREKRFLSEEDLGMGTRLACCVTVRGDFSVSVEKKGGAAQIKTDGALPSCPLAPIFHSFGAAVDIGTTTLAARLYDRAGTLLASDSRLNPQARFGADVISRMEAALASHGGELASLVRDAIDEMLSGMAARAGIDPRVIDAAVITGNTVMLSFLTETDTEPLTHAPFHANRLFGEFVTAGEVGLCSLGKNAAVYLPPCAGEFVGADIMTALTASGICESGKTAVLVDIGTNGEMVLAKDGMIRATSTAAGPAFEGAGISCGMGGKEGAVDRVWTEDGELCCHVIGDGDPAGVCGSGLVDAVACLLETEQLDETGYLEDDPAVIRGDVSLTQNDIRAVQLAKSAIHAGMRTLLKESGVSPDEVEELDVAGGFGSYLDIKNAVAIGLLPEELGDKVKVLGNAALGGASMILLSGGLRAACEERTKRISLVSLASNPVFTSEYMERMMF